MGGRGAGSGKSGGGGSGGMANKPALSRIEVNTDSYTFYNGKAPSGMGNWAFRIGGKEYFFSGRYSSAKAQAKKKAQSEGQTRVTLLT